MKFNKIVGDALMEYINIIAEKCLHGKSPIKQANALASYCKGVVLSSMSKEELGWLLELVEHKFTEIDPSHIYTWRRLKNLKANIWQEQEKRNTPICPTCGK